MTQPSKDAYAEATKILHAFQRERITRCHEIMVDASGKIQKEVDQLVEQVPSLATDTLRNLSQNLNAFVQNLDALKNRFAPPEKTEAQ